MGPISFALQVLDKYEDIHVKAFLTSAVNRWGRPAAAAWMALSSRARDQCWVGGGALRLLSGHVDGSPLRDGGTRAAAFDTKQ